MLSAITGSAVRHDRNAQSEDDLLQEINLGLAGSRFSGERFAYLKTRYEQMTESKAAVQRHEYLDEIRRQTGVAQDASRIAGEANDISLRAKHWSIAATCISGIAAAIALAALFKGPLPTLRHLFGSHYTWMTIAKAGAPIRTAISLNAATADIQLPAITNFQLSGIFEELDSSADSPVRFGYYAQIDVAHLDTAAIPEKYRETKPVPGLPHLTQLPLPEVHYKVHFTFKLRNLDGFVIQELDGQSTDIESGRRNQFHGLIDTPIPRPIADRVAGASYMLSIDKCRPCENQEPNPPDTP
jgi:hypothetical protein